jgi:replication factor A1
MSVFPIREISTYTGRNWTIKARVTSKSQMRTFSNDRGNGKVFSVDLLDKDGGEIKASFFNSSADRFFPTIDAGKVYTFSKGNVKVANKRYSTSKHNYEINFDADAVIEAVNDDDNSIESVKFNFTKIRDISTKHLPCTIDLVGVVKDFKPIGKIQPKSGGEELTRRSITLVDSSECAIDVTLWQDSASRIEESVLGTRPIVAIKGLSVKEYNGSRTCGTLQQSMIELVDANNSSGLAAAEQVKELVAWWSSNPSVSEVFNLSANQSLGSTPGNAPGSEQRGRQQTVTTIADMREECKRGFFGDKGIYFDIVAKLSFVSTKSKDGDIPIHYSACSSCNRKLGDDSRCFACDKTVANPKFKYLLRAQFVDHSDTCYLSVFDAQALGILKRPVEDFLQSGVDVPDLLKKAYFEKTYMLRVRATAQEYKGETRPRVTVVAADPVDPVSMGNRLLKKIIDKIGVQKEELEPIAEKENVVPAAATENEDQAMEDAEMPELKKMRMTDNGMEIEPTPIESKE